MDILQNCGCPCRLCDSILKSPHIAYTDLQRPGQELFDDVISCLVCYLLRTRDTQVGLRDSRPRRAVPPLHLPTAWHLVPLADVVTLVSCATGPEIGGQGCLGVGDLFVGDATGEYAT